MCQLVGLTNSLKAKAVIAGIVCSGVSKSFVWLLVYFMTDCQPRALYRLMSEILWTIICKESGRKQFWLSARHCTVLKGNKYFYSLRTSYNGCVAAMRSWGCVLAYPLSRIQWFYHNASVFCSWIISFPLHQMFVYSCMTLASGVVVIFLQYPVQLLHSNGMHSTAQSWKQKIFIFRECEIQEALRVPFCFF